MNNIWQHIKRLWGTPAQPDHPLSKEEREQVPINRYDEVADAAATFLSHPEADLSGERD